LKLLAVIAENKTPIINKPDINPTLIFIVTLEWYLICPINNRGPIENNGYLG
jgi:hypothetical protein